MITLVPYAGLCNRLHFLLSVIDVSTVIKDKMVVEWHSNFECHAYFDELFMPIISDNVVIRRGHWWSQHLQKKNLGVPHLARMLMGYKHQYDKLPPPNCNPDFANLLLKSRGKTYVSSCYKQYRHYRYPKDLCAIIIPRPEIMRQINENSAKFSSYTVGIHIRRTDNAKSIACSPTSVFRKVMDKEIAKHPEVKFFLATDDLDEKKALEQSYPKRILTQHDQVSRNTLEGMRGAVVDLWCLSRTNKIIGSTNSTFSEFASELGGIPLLRTTVEGLVEECKSTSKEVSSLTYIPR